jgi:hypothetical protein
MFTDDAVTPVRLEVLLDLLRHCRQAVSREEVYRLLQPEPLSDGRPTFTPGKATVRAALELQLVEEDSGKLTLASVSRKEKGTRSLVLAAFDEHVLAKTNVEKYFALFYSYYLGLGKQIYARQSQSTQQWADQFNKDVFTDMPQDNPFNATKLTGLHRWFSYAGLGWYDPADTFQANPYERLLRALPKVFDHKHTMTADAFMEGLSSACQELDGGKIFCLANPAWQSTEKKCTLGLSHALLELHLDKVIRLRCPADSAGWSVEEAEPPGDEDFKSSRFESVNLLAKP